MLNKEGLLLSGIFAVRNLNEEEKTAVLKHAVENNLTLTNALSDLILKGLASTQVEVKTSKLVLEDVILEEVCCN